MALLADDPPGRQREAAYDLQPYREAFARIDADPNQLLVSAIARGELVPGGATSGSRRRTGLASMPCASTNASGSSRPTSA